jgi:hypothetical protein
MYRFCLKLSRVFKSKVFLGISNIPSILNELDRESFINDVSRKFFILNQNYIMDFEKQETKYYLHYFNEKIEIEMNSSFKVASDTGLFCKLQDEDVLSLKELLVSMSRDNGKLFLQNKYFKEWCNHYKDAQKESSDIDPLVFMSKVYLSIVNRLDLKSV